MVPLNSAAPLKLERFRSEAERTTIRPFENLTSNAISPTAMKTTHRILTFLLLSGASSFAAVPSTINYQGIVADSTGTLIGATGALNRKVIFRIYDAATGGNRLWTEEQTVTIYKGEFSVLLGAGTTATGTAASESRPALDSVFTSGTATRYIEIMVDNGDGSITATDTPISPRQAITTAAFTFHAQVADSIASGTDLTITPTSGTATNYGLGWYGSNRTWSGVTVDGPVLYGNAGGVLGSNASGTKNTALLWNASGQVGIGATGSFPATTKLTLQGDDASTPASQLVIRGNTDANERLLIGFDTTNNRSTIQSYTAASTAGPLLLNPGGGLIGIGTSAPSARLSVEGSVSATGAGGYIFGTGGDADGGLFSPADGVVTLNTNGTERLRVTGTGSVGIGVSSPTTGSKLHVSGGNIQLNGGNIYAENSTNPFLTLSTGVNSLDMSIATSAGSWSTSAAVGDLVLRTSSGKLNLQSGYGASAITIDGSNKVGIGTATPGAKLHVAGSFQADGDMTLLSHVYMNNGGIMNAKNAAGTYEAFLWPRWTDNVTYFNHGSGGLWVRDSNSTPEVWLSGGRMAVSNIGWTNTSVGTITVTGDGTSNEGFAMHGYRAGQDLWARMSVRGDRAGIAFDVYNPGQNAGVWRGFSFDGDSNIDWYSDRTLKKDIVDAEPMLDRLMQLPFRRFHWKDMTDPAARLEFGVIAQEVEPLFPDIVATGSDGLKTVGYTTFATIACKALQEYKVRTDADLSRLSAQIREKDTKIEALEAKLAEQEKRATAKSAEDESQNARLIALEKLLSEKASIPQTVSIKAGE